MSEIKEIEADSDLAFQGYDENQSILGKNEYQIYYNDANNVLDKPIIIIDGFDPGDKRKIDPQSLNYDKNSQSVKELMAYDHDNDVDTPKKDLIDELNDLGYDVIIVNHPVNESNGIDGGSDYIQRNAFTLISLVRYINETKQGNEPNVVIGPSMGGLISRYALAYMEKKLAETGNNTKWNHDTRLWVSFDSPHQGANIPIGVQKGIQYFADEFEVESAQEFLNQQLNRPATKQMLVNHYTNNSNLPVGASNFRNRFQNELDQLGMPQNLRKVALINGSIMGALNGISKGKYLNITDDLTHLSPFFYPNPIIGAVHTLLSNIFADELVSDFYHSTNKKTGSEEHFTFDGGIKGNFLWWSWYTTRTSFKSISKPKGSYDIAPGGYFNAQGLLAEQSTTPDTGFELIPFTVLFHNLNTTIYDQTHSFIPTKSALSYTGSNVLDEVIGTKDRVCTGETPFDSYYAPKENEEHIFLTTKNVAWLTKEIEGNHQSPTIVYTPMIGNETTVTGQQLTYKVDPVAGNTTYNWYFDVGGRKSTNIAGWSIISNQGNLIRVQVGKPGLAVVVCEVSNPCSTTKKYLYVQVNSTSGGGDGEGGGDDPCGNNDIQLTYNSIKSNGNSNSFWIAPYDPCDSNDDGDDMGDAFRTKMASKDQGLIYSFSIHNIYGEKLYSKTQKENEFMVKNLKKGLYIVRYKSSKGVMNFKKIVID